MRRLWHDDLSQTEENLAKQLRRAGGAASAEPWIEVDQVRLEQ